MSYVPPTSKGINSIHLEKNDVFWNIIPAKATRNNFNLWYNEYVEQILYLYRLFQQIYSTYYSNKIDWDDGKVYLKFVKMIYISSSRHISKYV